MSEVTKVPVHPPYPEIKPKDKGGCDGCRWGFEIDENGIHRLPNDSIYDFCYLRGSSSAVQ